MGVGDELRRLRQQMDRDFEIHTERLHAQNLVIGEMQGSLEEAQSSLEQVQSSLEQVRSSLENVHMSFKDFKTGLQRYATASQASEASWRAYRGRIEQSLDMVQSALLSGELEVDIRFEQVEKRLSHLEERLDGAA